MKNQPPQKSAVPIFQEPIHGCRCHVANWHTVCNYVTLDNGKWRSVMAIAWRMRDADRRPN
jgi:hypothetical protein